MVALTGLKNASTEFVRVNPLTAKAGLAVAVAGGALATAAVVRAKRKKTSTKKKTTKKRKSTSKKTTKRKPSKKRKKISPKYARTAGKGKDTSTRRIRMTKNGQPYVILKSGKARFIKKSSARRSRKLKGGRY